MQCISIFVTLFVIILYYGIMSLMIKDVKDLTEMEHIRNTLMIISSLSFIVAAFTFMKVSFTDPGYLTPQTDIPALCFQNLVQACLE